VVREVWSDQADLRGVIVELTEHFTVEDYPPWTASAPPAR
jgi:hypothetical protein